MQLFFTYKNLSQKISLSFEKNFYLSRNVFRIYSKSQTRKFFATSKKFYKKILQCDFTEYRNIGVTKMYLFVMSRNLDVATMWSPRNFAVMFFVARKAYTKQKTNVTYFTKNFGI